jgi:aerobic C4-dicarboxylate transport protein
MNQAVPPGAIDRKSAQPFYLQLWFLVLVAMALGIALGHLYPDAGVRMEPLGEAFIRAIRVLIAPIIFRTVVHGIASMADMARVGRVALKALVYFEVLTTIALVLGLVAVNVFAPGAGMNVDLSHVDTASVAPYLSQVGHRTTAQFLLGIIPNTFIGAFAEGNVLQVLFVSVLCGFALSAMGQAGKPLTDLIGTVAQMFFRIVAIVMRAAPIGAFGAIAFTVGKFGAGSLVSLARQAQSTQGVNAAAQAAPKSRAPSSIRAVALDWTVSSVARSHESGEGLNYRYCSIGASPTVT